MKEHNGILRKFACELMSSWPLARVEGRAWATVSGPLPVDPLDPVEPLDLLENSGRRAFAVKNNGFGKAFGAMTPQKALMPSGCLLAASGCPLDAPWPSFGALGYPSGSKVNPLEPPKGSKAAPRKHKRSPIASQGESKEPHGTQKPSKEAYIRKNSRSTAFLRPVTVSNIDFRTST